MTLVLVRHGVAEGNAVHRFIGQSGAGLDAIGRRQAEMVAERLSGIEIDRIVSSDLRRCMETASPLAALTGIPVEEEPRLREIDNGEWTGLLPTEIEERWTDLWTRYVTGEDVPRPGGETWARVRQRVRSALRDLVDPGATTVVFTHAGPVVLAAEWALGVDIPGNIFRGPLSTPLNASITTIAPGPRLVGYGDVGHLRPLATVDVPYAPVRD